MTRRRVFARRGFGRGVVLVIVTALGITGLESPGRAQTAPTTRVSVIGDSVLLAARDEILVAFAGWAITLEASESLSLLGALGRLRELAATSDVVVLDLGYNDSTDPAAWRSRVERALDTLAQVPHVIWLDQRVFQPGRDTMNAILVETATRHPNVDVAPWNAEVLAHPEYVGPDGIHLVGAGPSAMAELVRTRVVASLTPATTTTIPTPTTPSSANHGPQRNRGRAGARPAPPDDRRDDDRGNDGNRLPPEWWGLGGVAVVGILMGVLAVRRRRRRAPGGGRQFRARQ